MKLTTETREVDEKTTEYITKANGIKIATVTATIEDSPSAEELFMEEYSKKRNADFMGCSSFLRLPYAVLIIIVLTCKGSIGSASSFL